jgi:hypothetical protein
VTSKSNIAGSKQHLDLPVDLLWDRDQPVVVFGRCRVSDFALPFWDDVARRRDHVSRIVPLDHISPEAGLLPIAGAVHHMTRCGSTLVMRQFAACQGVFGISEPSLIQKFLEGPQGALPLRIRRFRALLTLLCDALSPIADRFVLKWPMMAGLHAEFIAHAAPEIRNIFLHRPGVEVLRSIQRSPLGGMSIVRDHHLAQPKHPLPSDPMQRAASYIGNVCLCVCADPNLQAVAYARLPDIGWTDLALHFGIELSASNLDRMKTASVPHSKSVTSAPFAPRPEASADEAAIALIAARFIDPALATALSRITPLPVSDDPGNAKYGG